MRGLKPITTEPWANDALRFLDNTVERRGDYTDAGEVDLLRTINYVRKHGRAPSDIQSKLFEESVEYQEAVEVNNALCHRAPSPLLVI